MSFHTYFASNPSPMYGSNADAWGMSWTSASGGEGTVAISAGGYATTGRNSANGAAAEALPIPVHVRAVPGHPEELALGIRVPGEDGVLYIAGIWCIYWVED